jgi:hypothetical protein
MAQSSTVVDSKLVPSEASKLKVFISYSREGPHRVC